MFPLKKTKRTLVISILVFVIVFSVDLFFVFSIYKQRDTVAKMREDFMIELKKEKQLSSIKNTIKMTEKEQTNLNLCFIANNEVVDFIKSIETMSKNAGVSMNIRSVGVGDTETIRESSIEILIIEFIIGGSWSNTHNFLSLIENSTYEITINQMSINKISDSMTGKETWKSVFVIKAIKI